MSEEYGIIRSAGWETDEEGGRHFIVRVEYPNGVPKELKCKLIWDRTPVEITPIMNGGEG